MKVQRLPLGISKDAELLPEKLRFRKNSVRSAAVNFDYFNVDKKKQRIKTGFSVQVEEMLSSGGDSRSSTKNNSISSFWKISRQCLMLWEAVGVLVCRHFWSGLMCT